MMLVVGGQLHDNIVDVKRPPRKFIQLPDILVEPDTFLHAPLPSVHEQAPSDCRGCVHPIQHPIIWCLEGASLDEGYCDGWSFLTTVHFSWQLNKLNPVP